jgi:hypothetical protein
VINDAALNLKVSSVVATLTCGFGTVPLLLFFFPECGVAALAWGFWTVPLLLFFFLEFGGAALACGSCAAFLMHFLRWLRYVSYSCWLVSLSCSLSPSPATNRGWCGALSMQFLRWRRYVSTFCLFFFQSCLFRPSPDTKSSRTHGHPGLMHRNESMRRWVGSEDG